MNFRFQFSVNSLTFQGGFAHFSSPLYCLNMLSVWLKKKDYRRSRFRKFRLNITQTQHLKSCIHPSLDKHAAEAPDDHINKYYSYELKKQQQLIIELNDY